MQITVPQISNRLSPSELQFSAVPTVHEADDRRKTHAIGISWRTLAGGTSHMNTTTRQYNRGFTQPVRPSQAESGCQIEQPSLRNSNISN